MDTCYKLCSSFKCVRKFKFWVSPLVKRYAGALETYNIDKILLNKLHGQIDAIQNRCYIFIQCVLNSVVITLTLIHLFLNLTVRVNK